MSDKRDQHKQPEQRDGRATDTRRRILQVAEELYYAGGYEHINLQAIAERLGVSKTALFHHFKNKQELFYATMMAIGEHHYAMFASAVASAGPDARSQMRQLMERLTQESHFDLMRFMRGEYSLLTPEQQRNVAQEWQRGMFDVVRGVLEGGVARGELRLVDLTLTTFAFLHMCLLLSQGGAGMYSETGNGAPLPRVSVDSLLDLFLHGVEAGSHDHSREEPGPNA